MELHADCVAYMKRAEAWAVARGFPAPWEMEPARCRRMFHEFSRSMQPPLEPVARLETRRVPTRNGPLAVRIFHPQRPHAEPIPTFVYYHSGGYVIGGLDESEPEARRIAARTPAVVISVDYRMAPEHRHPAAFDDAWDALLWAADNAKAFGGDPQRLMVGGTSAGGGLAAAVSCQAAEQGSPHIALAVLLCPWLDLTMSQPSVRRFARGYDLDREFLDWFVAAYVGPQDSADDRRLSPALYPAPAGHPPALILAAECDPLFDEARLYGDHLRHTRIPVSWIEAPGMVHAFNEICHLIPAGEPLLAPVDAALRSVKPTRRGTSRSSPR